MFNPLILSVLSLANFCDITQSFCVFQAYRDNDRTAILDVSLANLLWEQTGLKDIFCDMKIKGKTAVGLNPNLRFYR